MFLFIIHIILSVRSELINVLKVPLFFYIFNVGNKRGAVILEGYNEMNKYFYTEIFKICCY